MQLIHCIGTPASHPKAGRGSELGTSFQQAIQCSGSGGCGAKDDSTICYITLATNLLLALESGPRVSNEDEADYLFQLI